MKNQKLVLVGYMGVGKSSIGKILSKKMNTPFFDTDELISINEKMSITDIFNSHGECYFRKQEHNLLKEILEKESFVLATGGGLPISNNNMNLINEKALSVFLLQSPHKLFTRIKSDNGRPLLEDKESFLNRYYSRLSTYRQAHLKILINKSYEEIVDRIIRKIR